MQLLSNFEIIQLINNIPTKEIDLYLVFFCFFLFVIKIK